MATYETAFAIRPATLNATTWTDIVGPSFLPIECDTVIIWNSSSIIIYLRSDPANALSQVPISPGQQFELGATRSGTSQGPRFPQNCHPVCSLLATKGMPTVIIESIR